MPVAADGYQRAGAFGHRLPGLAQRVIRRRRPARSARVKPASRSTDAAAGCAARAPRPRPAVGLTTRRDVRSPADLTGWERLR